MLKEQIRTLAKHYADELNLRIVERIQEMASDDKSHYLVYRLLNVSSTEGDAIDLYQNKGRFLYKYAGSFLEEAALLCFKHKFDSAECKKKIENPYGGRPRTFEIDCLVNSCAYEVKWRDATTDGDHITKEHSRVKAIHEAGYKPIRLMFYSPNRKQAIRIQETLKTIYHGLGGSYLVGAAAWEHIHEVTGVDLFNILNGVADENAQQ
ncbi:MAG: ApaLI family restriction endonuclease [Bdellovibrio sp.]